MSLLSVHNGGFVAADCFPQLRFRGGRRGRSDHESSGWPTIFPLILAKRLKSAPWAANHRGEWKCAAPQAIAEGRTSP